MSDDYVHARDELVENLQRRGQIQNESTAEALRSVPRHEFVPPNRREQAYADHPLPIGDDQTISAPHMVAVMTDLLELDPGDEVLEIGTGCGYHAAVTAEVVGDEHVYSVEYGRELAERARKRLDRLGYDDVSVRQGDGREGWSEHAPYDAAYFTCAVPELPDPVVSQIRDGGRILAPVGTRRQTLVSFDKADGELVREEHGGVRFVSLRG